MGLLDRKVALVTGASSGIGEAIARMLAAEGAVVVCAARRTDRLAVVREELMNSGADVHVIELDVTDEGAVRRAVDWTVKECGGLDILVNNAGVMLLGPVEGADTTDWARMMATNVMGVLHLTHAALPYLLERQGIVVQLSSVAGRVAGRGGAVYSATKFAVNAFSEGLRAEVTDRGVRVVVVEPGTVQTELRDHITHQPSKEAIEKRVATIRQLQAQDVAAAVRYAVTAPAHVAVNEILIRPTDQV